MEHSSTCKRRGCHVPTLPGALEHSRELISATPQSHTLPWILKLIESSINLIDVINFDLLKGCDREIDILYTGLFSSN